MTQPRGTVLKEEDIREIRKAADDGISQKFLAAKFGVSQPAISYIITRKRWRHVV